MADGRFCVDAPLSLRGVLVRCCVALALGAVAFAVGSETSAGHQSNGQPGSWAAEAIEVADGTGVAAPTENQPEVSEAFSRWECPAVFAQKLDNSAAEAKSLDAAFMQSEYISDLRRSVIDSREVPWVELADSFLAGPRQWARVPLPPGVAEALPGASVYAMHGRGYRFELLAVRKGKFYRLPHQLNYLLHDCGMAFQNSDAPAWTRALLFFEDCSGLLGVGVSGSYINGWRRNQGSDSIVNGFKPLCEALVVERMSVDTAVMPDSGEYTGLAVPGLVERVHIDVRICDTLVTGTIYTQGGGNGSIAFPWMLDCFPLDRIDLEFLWLNMNPEDEQPQLWLDPSELVYVEIISEKQTVYAVVERNGRSMSPRVEFRVTGLQSGPGDIRLRLSWRGGPPELHELKWSNNAWRYTWCPSVDLSGEWYAHLVQPNQGEPGYGPVPGTKAFHLFLECQRSVATGSSALVFNVKYCNDFFVGRTPEYIRDYVDHWLAQDAIGYVCRKAVDDWHLTDYQSIRNTDEDDTFDVFLLEDEVLFHGWKQSAHDFDVAGWINGRQPGARNNRLGITGDVTRI